MTDWPSVAEGLLNALVAMGRAREAEAFRARLTALGTTGICEADVRPLFAALSSDLAPSPRLAEANEAAGSPLPASASSIGPASRLPPWAAAISFLEPFLLTADETGPIRSVDLFARVNDLFQVTSVDALLAATSQLFVDALGYEAEVVDERPRLGILKTFPVVRRLARYQDLVVLATEDAYGGIHATAYKPLFQLHPHAVVVALHPALQRLRIVYNSDDTCRYWTLVGPRWGRHPLDNVLVATRRFSSLRPRAGETGRDLERRVMRAISASPEQIAEDWNSAPFIGASIPAPSWGNVLASELHCWLNQPATEGPSLHWGLNAVFRNRFPIPIARGAARLHLRGWSVTDAERLVEDRWKLIAQGRNRSVTVEVRLRISRESPGLDGAPAYVDFALPMELPLPDATGEMILDGYPFRLCFDAGSDPTSESLPEEWRESQGLEEEPGDEGDVELIPAQLNGDGEDRDYATLDLGDSEVGDPWASSPPTGSFGVLLTYLAERKLSALALVMWNLDQIPSGRDELLRAIRMLRGADREFSLIALSHLWKHVRQLPDFSVALPPALHLDAAAPPSWACAEASASEEPGTWIPIGGARLNPIGSLSIPVSVDDAWCLRTLRSSALEAQGRWNSSLARGPTEWWLAERLRWFANAEAGQIEWSSQIDPKVCAELRAVRIAGPELEITISERAFTKLRGACHESVHVQEVPAPAGKEMPGPELLCQRGAHMGPGKAWLKIPRELWPTTSGDGEPHRVDQSLSRIFERPSPTLSHRQYLGPDEGGQVTDASVLPMMAPIGGVRGWRAAIRLKRPVRRWLAALSDGRSVCLSVKPQADMPYDDLGAAFDIAVSDPKMVGRDQADDLWVFDAQTGELIESATEARILVAPVQSRRLPCLPDRRMRFRYVDGDGIPSDSSAPLLSARHRLWISGAQPRTAKVLAKAESQWNGGAPATLPMLHKVAAAIQADPLPWGPPAWSLPLRELPAVESAYDPMLHRTYRRPAGSSLPWRTWTCECRALSGQCHAATTCRKCASQVVLRATDVSRLQRLRLSLPEAALHPWRKRALGALLGITVDELEAVMTVHGARALETAAARALTDPLQHVLARLGSSKNPDALTDIGAGLRDLLRLLGGRAVPSADVRADLAGAFFLEDVTELPELERLVGARPGCGEIQAPGLILRYRRLRLAVAQGNALQTVHADAITQTVRLNIQRAVDRLYGDHEHPAPGTISSLSALLRRVWPTTRSGALGHSVPGQFRAFRDAAYSWNTTFELYSSSPPRPGGDLTKKETKPADWRQLHEPGDYVVWDGEILPIHRPSRTVERATGGSWAERRAFAKLLEDWVVRLALLASAAEALPVPEEVWTSWSWPADVPRSLLGQVVLREVWAHLESSGSSPAALLRLLEAPKSITLPHSSSEAEEYLLTRLQLVIGGADTGARIVRYCLSRVLSGWTYSRVSADAPLGGRWDPSVDTSEDRRIPEKGSDLWKLLPGFDILHAPEDWFASTSREPVDSTIARQMLRLDHDVAGAWWSGQHDVSKSPGLPGPEAARPVEEPSLESRFNERAEEATSADEPFAAATHSPLAIERFTALVSSWLASTSRPAGDLDDEKGRRDNGP